MKKNTIALLAIFFVAGLVFSANPHFGFAQTIGKGNQAPSKVLGGKGNQAPSEIPGGKGNQAPGVIPGGSGNTAPQEIKKLEDPLGEGTSIEGLILKLFEIIIYIGVPLVAFFLILSGFMFVSAQGNSEKIETAKSRLKYTIIGAILLLGAWTISKAIKGTIEDIKKGASIVTVNKFI